jgi:hypothetical protein
MPSVISQLLDDIHLKEGLILEAYSNYTEIKPHRGQNHGIGGKKKVAKRVKKIWLTGRIELE